MAYIGLRKPIMAARKGYRDYQTPFAFGKAIGLTVTPNYAEGSLHADDAQSEYDKEFTECGCEPEYRHNPHCSAYKRIRAQNE